MTRRSLLEHPSRHAGSVVVTRDHHRASDLEHARRGGATGERAEVVVRAGEAVEERDAAPDGDRVAAGVHDEVLLLRLPGGSAQRAASNVVPTASAADAGGL